jgi:hypothetical protein
MEPIECLMRLTGEESRIMPVAGGGFEQCCNAQAVAAADSLLVVATDVVQAANDKQQLEPMVDRLRGAVAETGLPGAPRTPNAISRSNDIIASRTWPR